MFDFKKPPRNGARIEAGGISSRLLCSIYPKHYVARCKFYDLYLVPFGHAQRDKDVGWCFSQEYVATLNNEEDRKMLQAMAKLIQ